MLSRIADYLADHYKIWMNALGIVVLCSMVGLVGLMRYGILTFDGDAMPASYSSPPEEASMNVYEKLDAGQLIDYLIIGDSIGQGDGAPANEGWSSQLNKKLRETYGSTVNVKRYTIGGGIALGGWADYAERPRGDYDLVFLCFGQNDQGAMSARQFGPIYENLIRRIRKDHPMTEMITFTESSLRTEEYPNVIRELSEYYEVLNADMRTAFRDSGMEDSRLSNDGVHPNGQGYALYAQKIFEMLTAGIGMKTIGTLPEAPYFPASVNFDKRQTLSEWTSLDQFRPYGPGLIVASEPGSAVTANFRGDFLGLDLVFQNAGAMIDIYVDGDKVQTIDTYWHYEFDVNWKKFVADDLGDVPHTLRIEVAEENHPASSGTVAKIKGFIAEPAVTFE